jgi:hypothetical protein
LSHAAFQLTPLPPAIDADIFTRRHATSFVTDAAAAISPKRLAIFHISPRHFAADTMIFSYVTMPITLMDAARPLIDWLLPLSTADEVDTPSLRHAS